MSATDDPLAVCCCCLKTHTARHVTLIGPFLLSRPFAQKKTKNFFDSEFGGVLVTSELISHSNPVFSIFSCPFASAPAPAQHAVCTLQSLSNLQNLLGWQWEIYSPCSIGFSELFSALRGGKCCPSAEMLPCRRLRSLPASRESRKRSLAVGFPFFARPGEGERARGEENGEREGRAAIVISAHAEAAGSVG